MKKNSRGRIAFIGRRKNSLHLAQVTLASLFGLAASAGAQQVVVQPPSVSVTPPAVLEAPPSEMQVFSSENPIASFPEEVQPLQLGPVTLRPHVFYQFLYGTGIQSAPGQQHDSIIQSFAPGMLLVLTPRWTLDYTPTFNFYSDKSFQNNVGQSVTLTGGASYETWTFGLSQNFTYSSSPQVQTGTQTGQSDYVTALTASCPLNSKMSVDLGLNQDFNFPSGFQTSKSWSTLDWLNYEFWPWLTSGVGAGLGYVNASPNMVFEQLQGRVGWRATDKISFQVSGGAEFTQVTDDSSDPLANPIVAAAIQYQPFDQTKLTVGASRVVSPSYYENQIAVVTSVNADLQQRLLGKLFLNVGAGYNWNNYTSLSSGVADQSAADYYSINVQLSAAFLKRGTAAVFYNYSDNSTAQSGLSYASSQIGFNIGYRY
jgi:hypothetical protein